MLQDAYEHLYEYTLGKLVKLNEWTSSCNI